ncbi:C40 family peptidase [Parabacteroides distasonis]|nr:C40 family peptidase [Parabacteroides distasonis]
MKRVFIFLAFFWGALGASVTVQARHQTVPEEIVQLSDSLRKLYAPDRRVELFDTDFTCDDHHVMLRGVTTSAAAKQALLNGLAERQYEVMDCLRVLPDEETLGEQIYGIVNLSVCNLRSANDFSSEMVTQALLGMPVRLLRQENWYQIQTPDRYIAWVHRVGIHPVTRAELAAWNQAEKLIITAHYGFVFSAPNEHAQTVSDCVAGNRFKLLGMKGDYYKVGYPDGREGYVAKAIAQPETRWRAQLKQDAASILQTAKTLMGIPYLWAGTSSKGVDCSGLVRTTLFLHDILIPRDASQQATQGERIEIAPDFSNLQPGDLLFFGQKATAEQKERVIHVAFYLGDKRFIHSQGDVRINSFDPTDPLFDAYNLGRLLFAARLLPYIDKQPALNTTLTNSFYHVEP